MSKLAENIKKEIISILINLKSEIIKNTMSSKQVASGETIRSIQIEESGSVFKLTGRSYFSTLETGRKAGKTPKNIVQIIREWVLNKGISVDPIPYRRQSSDKWQPKYTPQERGLISISGAIAYKIRTEGTKLHQEGGRKDIFTEPVDKAVIQIRQGLAGLFKTDIETL